MRLDQEFSVAAPVDRVWAFLMDVPAMAECIPGASNVQQVTDTTYNATVKTKIGPITASFGCRISITNMNEAARSGSVEISGKDSKIGGGVQARMSMSMEERDGETLVRIGSDIDILGKIGQYGHGMITKRANTMLDEFAACTRTRLA